MSERRARYDFFISYAHEDRERVREFDRSLRDLLRRPFRRSGFHTFRDETALSAGGDLTDRLRTAMQESRWLVVVLTEASARSHWVDREIAYWCEHLERRDRMIIVRADDTVDLEWDEGEKAFRSAGRLPPALVEAVRADPLYVDAPGARGAGWRDATVRVAAALLGKPPEEVAGEEYRLHRRRRRLARSAIVGLSLLTVASITAGSVAVRSSSAAREAQREAEDNAARAISRQAQALAPSRPALALALAAEAVARLDEPETADVLQEIYAAYGRTPGHLRGTIPIGLDVKELAFNHDGTLLAAAGRVRNGVFLWEPRTGEEATALGEEGEVLHSGETNTLAFSRDGRRLATAGADGTVRIWDPRTGDEAATLTNGAYLWDVAFSPDGTRLATADDEGVVRLWDPATGARVATFAGHTGWAYDVAFNHDGSLLASAGYRDNLVRVWNPATGDEVATLRGHTGGVFGVAFNHDGSRLASAGGDGTAKLWDPGTGAELDTLVHVESRTRHVNDVAFNHDGTLLATAGDDGTAKLWDPATGDEVATLAGHTDRVTTVAFNHDGSLVATASAERDQGLRLWDPTAGREIVAVGDRDTGGVFGLAFHPEGAVVATTNGGGLPGLWDPTSGAEVVSLTGAGEVIAVAFNHDGSVVATAGMDGTARLWDPESGDEIAVLPADSEALYDVAFNHDGSLLATTGAAGVVRLWDPDSGEEVASLAGEVTGSQVAFSHDGTLIAAVEEDVGTVRLWNPDADELVATLEVQALGIAFGHDRAVLATAEGDGTVGLWDPASGDAIATLRHFSAPPGPDGGLVRAVAFSPDDRLLASAGDDGTVKLWDVATRDEIATIPAHTDAINDVAFSPDGSRLATTSFDGTALVRRLVLTPAAACEVVSTEVTRAELAAALGDAEPQACTDLR